MTCKKCGKEFEGNFCPSCGTKFDVEDSERTQKNYTESKVEGKTRKKSKKKIIIVSSIVASALGLLVVFLLCLFNYINLPILSSLLNHGIEDELVALEDDLVDKKIVFSEKNTLYIPKPENIISDADSNISYVNNMIIIVFSADATDENINDVIDSINGKIVGNINSINQYQVQIAEHSLSELATLVEKIQENNCVLFAHYDRAYKNIECAIPPNDPWDNDVNSEDWQDSDVDGSNWWIEAIDAPSAWDYNDKFSNIKIGVVDNGFDTGHEDLNVTFPENFKVLNSKEDHGTHVAGIIGATQNNGKGISGIVSNSELICFDWQPTKWQEWTSGWETDTMIYAGLIFSVESGAKVINFSLGMAGNFPNGNIYSQNVIDDQGRTASGYLAVLLKDYDFIVVQAAGNGGVDAANAGLFASINHNNCVSWGNGRASSQGIMNRLLIVAAVERSSDGYIVSSFSDGGSHVNIAAPGGNGSYKNGEDIYSTVTGGMHGKYAAMPGTSMAAPIVTGVTSLVWSVNNDFTGDEVVDIVCSNTILVAQDNPISDQTTGDFPIVNAKLAVEAAIRKTEKDTSYMPIVYDEILGTYKGSYFANQGETGLTLTVYKEGEEYKALFDFYNLPGRTNAKSGKYYMDISYDINTDEFVFTATEWIDKPDTYYLLDLKGILNGNILSGDSPTRFSVTKTDESSMEETLFEQYIQSNLFSSNGRPYEKEGVGLISRLIQDYDGDHKKEMVTFSIALNPADQPYVEVEYYAIDNGVVLKKDSEENFLVDAIGVSNWMVCATYEEGIIRVFRSGYNSGGSIICYDYASYYVKNGTLVRNNCFSNYYNRGNKTYIEQVSGKTYSSIKEWNGAVESAGFSLNAHDHINSKTPDFDPVTDDYNTASCFKGNHIFALFNSQNDVTNGIYGFIYDNTGVLN